MTVTPSAGDEAVSALREVAALANAGQLAAARERVSRLIAAHPNSGAAHRWLGTIESAAGRLDEASAAFRRAVYLDPHDADALLHLALLRQRAGDVEDGGRLRRRARRADEKRDREQS